MRYKSDVVTAFYKFAMTHHRNGSISASNSHRLLPWYIHTRGSVAMTTWSRFICLISMRNMFWKSWILIFSKFHSCWLFCGGEHSIGGDTVSMTTALKQNGSSLSIHHFNPTSCQIHQIQKTTSG